MKTILVDAVHCFVNSNGEYDKEMQELLETYKNRKIVLTNADDEQIEMFNLNSSPYTVFTLKHQPNKPNPEYYKKMLKKFDLRAEDCVYFEHNKEAVASAKSVGIKTYHYDKDKKDLIALKKFLDEKL